ncbi:NAD(P)/FAD-dependent oxidoreductase [Streptomyces sp. AS58]|uniref:NAD(P)/FAD-dependent oxidoreductase n=1 Tax=Streptomyces sp. AS58 TaxID=1519489 RepID=UPI0018FE536F|nr:FAD-dependent oxidoreductase [Streptomyces sp. AS58]
MIATSLADAGTVPFWLDSPLRPPAEDRLEGRVSAGLVVVGGGYCGLWTALVAKERDPGADVVLIEGEEVACAASGRNGGFFESSLTHGVRNGERHYRDELPVLSRLAEQNFADFEATIERYGIDAELENSGVLVVATEEAQIIGLKDAAARSTDPATVFLDARQVREVVDSPLYRAGLIKQAGYAYVHPAKLAWGLKRACQGLGVRIFEHTRATGLGREGDRVVVRTEHGEAVAERVALATNGFPSLLRRTRQLTVPVYDYALVTEPLTREQLHSIGWTQRHGITDSGRQFHYYRRTADDRILFGGYDAIYHKGGRITAENDQRPATFELLADHFFRTFPQLTGVRFTHKWGGMIDMSTRLTAFHGVAYGGRVAYSAGYTGLGVGATRFGAETMLDLLEGLDTERTRLRMARSKPFPIPPEPLAYPLIQLMRRAVEKSDANGGKDGPLLRLCDALGIGFDS